ncbi:MAG: hypothetical protein ACSHX3_04815 [Litorimonas sp.]
MARTIERTSALKDGSEATAGPMKSGRFGLSVKIPSGIRLGVYSFVDFGDTSGLRVLNGNEAEAGSFVSFDLRDSADIYIGTLYGLTASSDDNQVCVFVGKSF